MGARDYDGVLALQGIADVVGVPVAQLNFFVGCAISLFVAVFYRKWLTVPSVPSTTRHIFNLITGILIAGFVVGCGVFLFTFGFLFLCHIYLMLYPFKVPALDITYCLMVSTQKLTTLGFNLGDWYRYGNTQEKMTPEQRAMAVRKFPSVLEFGSYMLGFQTVVMGPFCFYNDYISFVDGSHYSQQLSAAGAGSNANYKLDAKRVPSPNKAVLWKVAQCLLWTGVHLTLPSLLPVERNTDPSFIQEHGTVFLILHCVASLFCYRARYYFGWTIADAVNNASGFGFAAFDENGEAKWDMLTNCYVQNIEFATSFKAYIDNWNLSSIRWLRFICYSRAPLNPTIMTFVLSALWHGFWPGYYVMFLSGALFTFAARKWRRIVRPHFQTSQVKRFSYDIATWIATQMTIAYVTVPFVVLKAQPIITFYNNWYWSLHIIAVGILLLLPSGRSAKPVSQPKAEANTANAAINSTYNDIATNHAKSKDL
ncbi:hypothetical protein BaRGS_00005810 [Batillaria attramentaria]|uniref:Uncharacterized protein n=1 Tax=Batillaria attramentaria TaxID=370345 RepID=A0ABD0LUV3_9CAEN